MSEQMQAGKELNKLIGEKLFGYSIYRYDKDYEENCYFMLMNSEFDSIEPLYGRRKTEEEAWNDSPDFSGSWEGMRLVVEEMRKRKICIDIEVLLDEYKANPADSHGYMGLQTYADTAPHAVCVAALKALEMDET